MEFFKNKNVKLLSSALEPRSKGSLYSTVSSFSQYFTVFTFPSRSHVLFSANLQCSLVVMSLYTSMQLLFHSDHVGEKHQEPVQSNSRYKMVMSRLRENTLLTVHWFKSVRYIHRTKTNKKTPKKQSITKELQAEKIAVMEK